LGIGGRDQQTPLRADSDAQLLSLVCSRRLTAVNQSGSNFALSWSELLPLVTHPIPAAGVLSPGVVGAVVRLPAERMDHNHRVRRIVVPLYRMPTRGAGLIADNGARRAIPLNRYRRLASRRARGGLLRGSGRFSCKPGDRRRGQRGYQEVFY
jgi:hypothetical protein